MLRHALRQAIPSMFHRRLLLLGSLFAAVLGALALRAATMTTGETHRGRKQQVEGVMVRTRYAPARRGNILDRNGVVLAEDRPGWNIVVHYEVLSGEWAKNVARKTARSDPAWGQSSDEERDALLSKAQTACAVRLKAFWEQMAAAAKADIQVLYARQDAIVRKVSRLREAQFEALWERAVAKSGDASLEAREKLSRDFCLAEEKAFYAMLSDVGEEARLAVQDIIDAPDVDDDAPAEAGPARPKTLWQKLGLVSSPPETAASAALPAPKAPIKTDTPWRLTEVQLVRARRYPCETATVAFDRSTLPGNLRSAQPLKFTLRGIGMHALGYTRKANDRELAAAPFITREGKAGPTVTHLHGLMAGDLVGAMGVEKALEDSLRGTRGEIKVKRSASELAQDRRTEPVAGQDVQLSLDIRLQTRVDAAMSREVGLMRIDTSFQPRGDSKYFDLKERTGGRLNGAAVVLDAATGEVLAAASAPGVSLEDLQVRIGELWADQVDMPMANRVSGVAFQPGSIVKPLVLAAAITEGVYQPGEIMDIPGYPFLRNPKAYRDYYYNHNHRPLGPHSLDYAIAASSSPPFVMLTQTKEDRSGKPRLGPTRWFDWADRFGIGHRTHAGLAEDARGSIGLSGKATPVEDACVTGMGQGPIAVTPLQMAVAYCRILAGHMGASASFLKRPGNFKFAPPPGEKTVPEEAVAYVLKGMRMAVEHPDGTFHATAHYPAVFNCPGVTVWAKSGTAQMWPQKIPKMQGGKPVIGPNGKVVKEIVRGGDHAWAAVLCAPASQSRPRFVILTMLEYGGSGGRAAGPIANQVIHALKAEGYLEKEPKPPAGKAVPNPVLAPALDTVVAGEPAIQPLPPEDVPDGTQEGGTL